MISFNTSPPLKPELQEQLKAVLIKIINENGFKLDSLTYILTSDEELLEMNKSHLNHDYYTDVITFDLSDDDKTIDGEVYISTDRVLDNSTQFNVTYPAEFCRVAIHGLLHLVGYNDHSPSEVKIIRQKENEYLNLLPF